MGRIRSVITLAAGAAVLAVGTGCSGAGFWKGKAGDPEWKVPAGVPSAPMSPGVKPDGVVQAGAVTAPTSALASNLPPSLSWLSGKSDKVLKNPATSIAVAWRNRIDHLPDPARDGAMGQGLAGQVFLFGPRDQPAPADGTLTVDLYDETPRPAGFPANKPERWQFKKDVLRNLRSMDERFGPCYVVFLPWPAYRPDVTRVRIRVRFDPDQGGFPLYAEETKLTIDTSTIGGREVGATASTHALPGGFAAHGSPPSGPGPGMGVFTIHRPGTQPAGASSGPPPAHVNAYTIGTIGGGPPVAPVAPMGPVAPAPPPSPDSFAPLAPIGPIAPTRP